MNSSEVRKFIKKGELAVEVLESLGYTFSTPDNSHPVWVKPVEVLDPILESIKKLIESQVESRVIHENGAYGPRWDSVKGLKGRPFKINHSKIPDGHKLERYGVTHFWNKLFVAQEIRYENSETFKGYVVLFKFNTKPFTTEAVWLPLSACSFQTGGRNAEF